MEVQKITSVFHIRLSALLTPNDYQTVYNLLFARRYNNETPNISKCINLIAIGTKTRLTFNEDDNKDEILIYWGYDPYIATLPRFKNDLISVYNENVGSF
jgi:hypothetical protein